MRTSVLLICLGLTLAAGGCGGEEESPPRPMIAAQAAERLAQRSEQIAATLDAGDVCTAAGLADDLLDETKAAINAGQVPARFQEDLTARANELVNTINCPPPPEEEEEEEDKDKDKDKEKDKDKDKGEGEGDGDNGNGGGNEPVPTLPIPTETGG
jgi:hypothetical protein